MSLSPVPPWLLIAGLLGVINGAACFLLVGRDLSRLAWYALLAAAVLGLKLSFRRHWRDLVLPMGFAAGWVVALALTEGNTGNIFRHFSSALIAE